MTGLALIVLSCAGMGLSAAAALRREERGLRLTMRILGRMETLILHRLLPLPRVMDMLAAEYPEAVSGTEGAPWRERTVGREGSALLTELTQTLRSGGDPEQSFAWICAEAKRRLSLAEERSRTGCRLYAGGGLLAGLLLAVLLW